MADKEGEDRIVTEDQVIITMSLKVTEVMAKRGAVSLDTFFSLQLTGMVSGSSSFSFLIWFHWLLKAILPEIY